ncbi:hypothetical protein JCM11491_004569 [Sporobolomyces phaffii]
MGVSGLWTELEPAHSITTWSQLSDAHFRQDRTPPIGSNPRGLRVGIDLSLWLCHVEKMDSLGQDEEGNVVNPGLNADLRCIFYRICRLLQRGILAVFVFDGPNKPSWKRGKYVGYGRKTGGGNDHANLKHMFELMGMEWRIAAGEAEAELAAMNARGEIDAVLSDDVDSFLFGATLVIRNMSKTLSANKSKIAVRRKATLPTHSTSFSSPMKPTSSFSSLQSSSDLHPEYSDVPPAFDRSLVTFSYDDILSTTGLSREDMILVALMSGGDYSEGIRGCGVTTAKLLAQAGFGRTLLRGIKLHASDRTAQRAFLEEWREQVAEVLRTNPDKLLEKKSPALATKLVESSDFPSLEIVNNYASPRVSEAGSYDPPTWDRDVDLEGLIAFVTDMFEWGHEQVRAKFRNNLWVGLLMRRARRTAIGQDEGRSASSPSKSSPAASALVQSVINFKCESSTDFTPSYSLHLDSTAFDSLIDPLLPRVDPWPFPEYDLYPEEDAELLRAERKRLGRAVERPQPPKTSDFRHWVPVAFVSVDRGCRSKVAEWRDGKDRKEREKEEKEERKAERARARAEGKSSPTKAARTKKKESGQASRKQKFSDDSEGEGKRDSDDEEDTAKAIERLGRDKVAKARQELLAGSVKTSETSKGKAKGKARATDVFADSTISRTFPSPRSASSDIEIVENPPNSRLRPPKKPTSPPPSFNLYGSTKPTLVSSTAARQKQKTSTITTPFFSSTKASVAIPPKRSVHASPPSSDSDSRHLAKANRRSKTHKSPVKINTTKPGVIELSSASDEDGARHGNARRSADSDEDLEAYLIRRQNERTERSEANKRPKKSTSSSRSSSSAAKGRSRVATEKKTEVETLVLSD